MLIFDGGEVLVTLENELRMLGFKDGGGGGVENSVHHRCANPCGYLGMGRTGIGTSQV
jgi:hypothetical protein